MKQFRWSHRLPQKRAAKQLGDVKKFQSMQKITWAIKSSLSTNLLTVPLTTGIKELKSKRVKQALMGVIMTVVGITGCQKPSDASADRAGEEMKNTPSTDQRGQPSLSSAAAIWPKVDAALPPQPDIEAQVAALLNKMSLEQKVAQMIQPEIRDFTPDDMREYGFGSYLNGGGSFPNQNKHAAIEDWIQLADDMYVASMDASKDGIAIPALWGTDAVHGHTNVIGATIFPHNIGLGAANNPELVKQIAQLTAQEVAATGIDWVFAPTVAVARDDRWGRSYESYSEDPTRVADYAEAFVKGMQGEPEKDFLSPGKTLATLKHFIGDGGTEQGDDQGDTIVEEDALFQIHGQGYARGIAAGAQFVMASFNSWQGRKLHGHHYLLQQVLKDRMGFDGVVVGDWNGHGQVAGCSNESCPQAINAGVDILMAPGQSWKPLYYNTIEQVQRGDISMQRIDDAVSRILRVKFRAGLFQRGKPSEALTRYQLNSLGDANHRAVARDAVRQSLVLLKNNRKILPLHPKQTFLLTGAAADNIGQQSGGWTITWQGTGNNNQDFPGATSIYQGLKTQIEQAGGKIFLSDDGSFQHRPDVAIVVFGEQPYAEGNGDISNLEFERGNKRSWRLLKKLKAEGIPTVSVFLSGRPMWVNPELNQSDAFVAAWLPGSEGEGIADVLLQSSQGEVQFDFVGKLPFSWPRAADQAPLNAPYIGQQPLFPLGFGLSYQQEPKPLAVLSEQRPDLPQQPPSKPIFQRSVQPPFRTMLANDKEIVELVSNSQSIAGLQVRTVDRLVQEDALAVAWTGTQSAGIEFSSPFTEDLRDWSSSAAIMSFDLRLLSSADGPLWLNDHALDLRQLVQLDHSQWQTIAVPLGCLFVPDHLSAVAKVFSIRAEHPWQVQLANVVIQSQPLPEQRVVSCESIKDE